ncbi:MAG: bifunctional diaminohydroxyphosphoribosylaminopyrimidine deaminase/5-amino-6-(5-phosphoribosylamino)uracil reductase RibD [Candidatus Sericytochromatia bacterium]|nr:bifunctional diaminohydroxyphosphoribosylaminopyrimidine deaminase/5-amino-6-(5-phosphoribosylamino)uracil reductase RibD [Candidatus Sericytochromatia bacterium]
MQSDSFYMQRALDLARQGRGRTSPNPMVGAVVVKDGQIVGEGFHPAAGMPHAEIYALQAAGEAAEGGTLYVTLEPCTHHGRTPPCIDRVITSKLKRVVVAAEDPNPINAGKGLRMILNAGIEVSVGCEEAAAKRLNEVFAKYITTKRPFVVMKAAMSLDGKIATSFGDSQWIVSEVTNQYLHELRGTYDAVMVGANTVFQDNPQISCKSPGGRDPVRIILDSQARTPANSKIFIRNSTDAMKSNCLIFVSSQAPEERIRALQAAGAEVVVASEDTSRSLNPRVDLEKVMVVLGKRGVTSVLMESGGVLNAAAIQAGIIDKLLLLIAPRLIGGERAPSPIGGEGITVMSEAIPLYNWQWRPMDSDMICEAYLHPQNWA